ncbi:kinesin motor protein cin8 [Lunasporangiospora selenospora]|uniref:Kinesin motor protein cin8 n=1 Tax=Lunasporangiospora selenospora TaxID=979761 RepID=A0A9P6FTH7_9FUNG|nr:kinesin motor protein cin8 [Lunasporangiospora selenospora]
MFNGRNGAGQPSKGNINSGHINGKFQPGGAVQSIRNNPLQPATQQHQQQQQQLNRDARAKTGGSAIRRSPSVDSVSSGSSANSSRASRSIPMQHNQVSQSLQPPAPKSHHGSSLLANASSGNKELNIQVVLRCRAPSKTYTFDRVFMYSDQEVIYSDVVAPTLDEVLAGYNCTIFAYGQTGTGKTFTMEGDLRDNFGECSRDAGIIPRTLYHLFAILDKKDTEFSVRVSFLELYNEEVKDLLATDDDRKVVKIFDSVKKQGPLIQGLEEFAIYSAGQGIEALRRGSGKRTVASTKSNDKSSRSHGVFSITVHVKETTDDGEELLKIGKLNLVDLAGSENIARSGAEATQAKEAGRINQSLLTLGRVINSLVERSQHIPYRESKLTRLLEDSLGGKTKTCIIATISPARSCLEETISTLNYANRAKNIKNTPEVNQKMSKKTLIKEYLLEIDRLKADLHATREKNGVFMTQESHQALLDENTSNKDMVIETQKQAEKANQELQKVEEKFRENLKLLTVAEHRLGVATTELEVKQAELHMTQDELTTTRQSLEEESILRQAHAQTEAKLDAIATGLRSTLTASIQDNEGLHGQLERKIQVEQKNKVTLTEFQGRAAALGEELFKRLNVFRKSQTESSTSAMQRLEEALRDSSKHIDGTQQLMDAHVERINQAIKTLQRLDISTSKEVATLQQGLEETCKETRELLKTRTDITKATALEGFASLKKAIAELVDSTSSRNDAIITGVTSLIDESARFTKEQTVQFQRSLDHFELETKSEIDRLKQQNLELKKKLTEQEARQDEQRSQLLSNIGNMLNTFLGNQSKEVMGLFLETSHAHESSFTMLDKAHEEQRAWASTFRSQGEHHAKQLDSSKEQLQIRGVDAKKKLTEGSTALSLIADKANSIVCSEVDNQSEAATTRLAAVDRATVQAYNRMKEHISGISQHSLQTSSGTVEALQDLKVQAAISSNSLETNHALVANYMETSKTRVLDYSKEAGHSMEQTRAETAKLIPHYFKMDDPSGKTPQRRKYDYPQTWSLTRPTQDILKEFREHGQVSTFTVKRETNDSEEAASEGSALSSSQALFQPIKSQEIPSLAAAVPGLQDQPPQEQKQDVITNPTEVMEMSTKTPSPPVSRRSSVSSIKPELEKKESSLDQRVSAIPQPSAFARPVRPTLATSKKTAFQNSPFSLLSKRTASEMEANSTESTNSLSGGNVVDVTNNSQVASTMPLQPKPVNTLSKPNIPPENPSGPLTGLFSGFNAGKSGMVNSSEGPRKVSRTIPSSKPTTRRLFPFSGKP